jgi:hypothetical protein
MLTSNAFRGPTLAILGLAFVLAACGGSTVSSANSTGDGAAANDAVDQTTEPAPSTDAAESAADDSATGGSLCDVVPIEHVELALGGGTDGGVASDSFLTGGESCRFTADAEHVVDVSTSEQTRDEWFQAIETVGLTDEAVVGIGDEAYRAAETALGGPGARFTAWADGFEVGVTIYSGVDQEISFAAAEAIAVAVLSAGQ